MQPSVTECYRPSARPSVHPVLTPGKVVERAATPNESVHINTLQLRFWQLTQLAERRANNVKFLVVDGFVPNFQG